VRKTVVKVLHKRAFRENGGNAVSKLMANIKTGALFWKGFRRVYQDLKKEYRRI
jgi:hypothetical protein